MPLVIGIPGIVLCLFQLFFEFRARRSPIARQSADTRSEVEKAQEEVARIVGRKVGFELARRKMGVGEFAEAVGLTPANVAVLKNGRAKAVRFSTLEAMCRVLECQPGDLLEWVDGDADVPDKTA